MNTEARNSSLVIDNDEQQNTLPYILIIVGTKQLWIPRSSLNGANHCGEVGH